MLFLDENLFKFKKEEMTVLQTVEEKITNFPLVGLLGSRIKKMASQIPFPGYMTTSSYHFSKFCRLNDLLKEED